MCPGVAEEQVFVTPDNMEQTLLKSKLIRKQKKKNYEGWRTGLYQTLEVKIKVLGISSNILFG